jgi:hypothetical protein
MAVRAGLPACPPRLRPSRNYSSGTSEGRLAGLTAAGPLPVYTGFPFQLPGFGRQSPGFDLYVRTGVSVKSVAAAQGTVNLLEASTGGLFLGSFFFSAGQAFDSIKKDKVMSLGRPPLVFPFSP